MKKLPETVNELEEHLQFIQTLMGSKFETAWKGYQKAKTNQSVPHFHRLMFLYDQIEQTKANIKNIKNQPIDYNLISAIEIELVRSLFSGWQSHSAYPEICRDIVTPQGYVHALCLLARCQMAKEHCEHDIEPVCADDQNGKVADALMSNDYETKLSYEMKAPKILLQPSTVLSMEDAGKLVEKIFKKARGQIGNMPSVLGIGGLYLSAETRKNLEIAIKEYFDRKKPRQIALAEIVGIGVYLLQNPTMTDRGFIYHKNSKSEPRIEYIPVLNSYYKGDQLVKMPFDNKPTPKTMKEIALRPDQTPIVRDIQQS